MGDYKQLALFPRAFVYAHSEAVPVRAGTVVLGNETLDLGKLSREFRKMISDNMQVTVAVCSFCV